mgnify:CR=1 FL=1
MNSLSKSSILVLCIAGLALFLAALMLASPSVTNEVASAADPTSIDAVHASLYQALLTQELPAIKNAFIQIVNRFTQVSATFYNEGDWEGERITIAGSSLRPLVYRIFSAHLPAAPSLPAEGLMMCTKFNTLVVTVMDNDKTVLECLIIGRTRCIVNLSFGRYTSWYETETPLRDEFETYLIARTKRASDVWKTVE